MAKSTKPKAKKAEIIKLRVDPELKQQIEAKAESRGWSIGAVARALFRLWIDEDVISPEDVGEEQKRPPKKPRKRVESGGEQK